MNLIITEEHAGERLDTVLAGVVENTSRTDIQNRVKSGHITVNGKTVKPNYKVKKDDRIELLERENVEADIVPENLNLDIVYEDDDVAVVNKDRGMVVHPAAEIGRASCRGRVQS